MDEAVRISVVSSGAFAPALRLLAPMFERASGFGVSVQAVPAAAVLQRLADRAEIDVVIMSAASLADMVAAGRVTECQDVARSRIGLAVRQGAGMPDISTPEALARAVLAAGTIALSRSVSGVYVQDTLLARLGVAGTVAGRLVFASGEPAGALVARGAADIAFQQISELMPVPGITLVGPIPDAVQLESVFSAGLVAWSGQPEPGRALMRYLASAPAREVILASGMDPAGESVIVAG